MKSANNLVYIKIVRWASLFGLFLLGIQLGRAQRISVGKDSICIVGSVINEFTGEGLGGASIKIYDADGKVVAPFVLVLTYGDRRHKGNEFRFFVPRKDARYRLHVKCKGYEPLDYWYEIKNHEKYRRTKSIKMPAVKMKRDYSALEETREQQLGEAVVQATKVKLYYRGDTLIYNADAFKLPDGSMLDDLIAQLPGAELKSDGQIFINGRKLDFLLLNGKEFFSGNNKIMLDNLPYYVVDKLKVYEESSQRSKALGHDVESKRYVMDVRLKREYSVGYMGNVQVAGGTEDRYLARLFGLRFSDYSRLTFFAGSNNVNETRLPSMETGWKLADNLQGTVQNHQAGLDFLVDNSKQSWEEKGNVLFNWAKNVNEQRTSSETFLEGEDAYGRTQNWNKLKNFSSHLHNNFTLKNPFHLDFKTDLQYEQKDLLESVLNRTFNAHPEKAGTDTLNSAKDWRMGDGKKVYAKQTATFLHHLNTGDDIELYATADYSHSEGNDYSRYKVCYRDESMPEDKRHRYDDSRLRSHLYNMKALYRFNYMQDYSWELSYQYQQRYSSEQQMKYRLDQIIGWDDDWEKPIDLLPSTIDLLRQGLDNANSYASSYQNREHVLHAKFATIWFYDSKYRFTFDFEARRQSERNHYNGSGVDTLMRRKQWLYNGNVSYSRKFGRNDHTLSYYWVNKAPEMMQLVPVQNTYNPLVITEGNPDLKKMVQHFLSYNQTIRWKNAYTSSSFVWNYYSNFLATDMKYDRRTGIYTYRPENINGNYQLYFLNTTEYHPVKHKALRINNKVDYIYSHNVDLVAGSNTNRSVRNTVHNHLFSEKLKINYYFKRVQLGLNGKVDYRYLTSGQQGFRNIHAIDYDYGLETRWQMPWKLYFTTGIHMSGRRGYGDASMNSDDLVWNAALARSFLKNDRLTVTLQGFDLLHNLSNVTYVINGQGRTETWNRSLTNYLMLHLQWKFNINPKKK